MGVWASHGQQGPCFSVSAVTVVDPPSISPTLPFSGFKSQKVVMDSFSPSSDQGDSKVALWMPWMG